MVFIYNPGSIKWKQTVWGEAPPNYGKDCSSQSQTDGDEGSCCSFPGSTEAGQGGARAYFSSNINCCKVVQKSLR